MAAELGESTDPQELIPGEPERITNDLRQLVGNIDQIGAAGDGLSRIDPAQWTGQGSDAFREAFRAEPPQWFQAVDILGQGGQSLADYGDVLTWAQGEAQRAIEMYTQAQAASRMAAAQYDAQAQAVQAVDQVLAPFQDPGQAAAQGAQAILDNARSQVELVGGQVAQAFGFEPDGEGGYKKDLGEEKAFGADHRKREWDPAKEEWVDRGGWQKTAGGRSYLREWGTQSDGLLADKIGDTLKALGIDVPEKTWAASAGVDVLHGGLEGEFTSGPWSGSGKVEGSVLGAGAEAHASLSALGLTAGASAEAYLAKGSAEGGIKLGEHAAVSGAAEAKVGADAKAEATIGPTGAQGHAEAFVGAKISGDAGAEVAGVSAGVHGEAWAGAGAEVSGQAGMGDDGKFHVGASVGIGLGIGGKVGFDVSVDPGEVVDTVKDVAGDVGEVAKDVGEGVAHVASDIGDGVSHVAKGVGHFLGL